MDRTVRLESAIKAKKYPVKIMFINIQLYSILWHRLEAERTTAKICRRSFDSLGMFIFLSWEFFIIKTVGTTKHISRNTQA